MPGPTNTNHDYDFVVDLGDPHLGSTGWAIKCVDRDRTLAKLSQLDRVAQLFIRKPGWPGVYAFDLHALAVLVELRDLVSFDYQEWPLDDYRFNYYIDGLTWVVSTLALRTEGSQGSLSYRRRKARQEQFLQFTRLLEQLVLAAAKAQLLQDRPRREAVPTLQRAIKVLEAVELAQSSHFDALALQALESPE
ncbi:MAG TPA: hypothetical protein VLI05_04905 [Candidatus Saccharimonadia bacterium]|nr:hypothetical protein [Candidatus Saccharimonadia bacterium]